MALNNRLASIVVLAGAAATSAGLAASPAEAASTITANYPVSGSTFIHSLNSSIPLGPGTLTATVDLSTGAVTGSVNLPAATGSFKEFGFIPVTATTEFVPDGPTTGQTTSTGGIQATAQITLKLTDLKVAGLDIPVGRSCETSAPAAIALASAPGFDALKGGVVNGTYTIPRFSHCLLATPLINLTIPGAGNTITLTLGTPTFG
jgi:hypothetical protein